MCRGCETTAASAIMQFTARCAGNIEAGMRVYRDAVVQRLLLDLPDEGMTPEKILEEARHLSGVIAETAALLKLYAKERPAEYTKWLETVTPAE